MPRFVQTRFLFWEINPILLFQSANVILMVQQLQNVTPMVIVNARRDSLAANVILLLVRLILHKYCYIADKDTFSVGSKVLVATGVHSGGNTEVIDLEDSSFSCKLNQFPEPGLSLGSGGFVDGTAFLCGGRVGSGQELTSQKSCYTLDDNGAWQIDEVASLNTARDRAATGSVILNKKLVIAGGFKFVKNGAPERLSTIEVVAPKTMSKILPVTLPVGISAACIVPWDTNTFMIIGGDTVKSGSRSKETYFVNMGNNTVTNGPDLLTGRDSFACHEMTVGGESYIIVAGGYAANYVTEVLAKSSFKDGWKKSKNMTVLYGKSCLDYCFHSSCGHTGSNCLSRTCSFCRQTISLQHW